MAREYYRVNKMNTGFGQHFLRVAVTSRMSISFHRVSEVSIAQQNVVRNVER